MKIIVINLDKNKYRGYEEIVCILSVYEMSLIVNMIENSLRDQITNGEREFEIINRLSDLVKLENQKNEILKNISYFENGISEIKKGLQK